WFVMASNMIEAQAPSATQTRRRPQVGAGIEGSGDARSGMCAGAAPRTVRMAMRPHNRQKPTKPQNHSEAWAAEPMVGSTRKGKVKRPSREPMFERAESG